MTHEQTFHWVTCFTCQGGFTPPNGEPWGCKECGGMGRIKIPGPAGIGPQVTPRSPTLEERKVIALEAIAAALATIAAGDGKRGDFWSSLRAALDTEGRTE